MTSIDLDYTPGEYASLAGVVNIHGVMKLADSLHSYAPRVSIQLGGDYLSGAKYWSVEDHRTGTGRIVKKFFYENAAGKKLAAEQALDWATTRYGVPGWGKVTGIRDTFVPKVLAEEITGALKTARRNGTDPADFKTAHGL